MYGKSIAKTNGFDPDSPSYYPVAIVGAGESGIAMGCRLKEVLGFDQFRIFDRMSGLGGTWYCHRYPGVACDVPAVFYSYSFFQNPKWTKLYPTGAEILRYLHDVCQSYEIMDKIQLNTAVKSCAWNNDEGVWDVVLEHLTTGSGDLSETDRKKKMAEHGYESVVLREEKIKVKVLVSAVGVLVEPQSWPTAFPGAEEFAGTIFHSARWRWDVDLKDKDVVVVGTGCSAVQFVPKLLEEHGVKSLTHIMRTPPWCLPRLSLPGGNEAWERWSPSLFSTIPGLQRVARFLIFAVFESEWRIFGSSEYAARERAKLEKGLLENLKTVPEKYHQILTPNYSLACKRRVFDAGWLQSLNDPRIELTTMPPTQLHESSITLGPGRTYPPTDVEQIASKTVPADVIILANGFETLTWLHPLQVYGRDGQSLDSVFEERGGPQMYLGTAMDGFPNFFAIVGPNTVTGHSSVILATENMVGMILSLIKPVLNGDAEEVEVTKSAEMAFTADIQKALKSTVWHRGGCHNWFKNPNNDWDSMGYPYSQVHFTFKCLFPTFSHWTFKLTKTGATKQRLNRALRYMSAMGAMAGLYQLQRRGIPFFAVPTLVGTFARWLVTRTGVFLQGVGAE